MISGYIFGIIWEKGCVYLFDSHSKDYEGNISQNRISNFDDLQDYIKLIYCISEHSIFRFNSSVLAVQIILEKPFNQN